jgi:hypothetical protein
MQQEIINYPFDELDDNDSRSDNFSHDTENVFIEGPGSADAAITYVNGHHIPDEDDEDVDEEDDLVLGDEDELDEGNLDEEEIDVEVEEDIDDITEDDLVLDTNTLVEDDDDDEDL